MTDKLLSVGKGLLIAAAGAALTYVTAWISGGGVQEIFGEFAPIIVAALSVGVNAGRKLLASNE
jgi:hypothetical protein